MGNPGCSSQKRNTKGTSEPLQGTFIHLFEQVITPEGKRWTLWSGFKRNLGVLCLKEGLWRQAAVRTGGIHSTAKKWEHKSIIRGSVVVVFSEVSTWVKNDVRKSMAKLFHAGAAASRWALSRQAHESRALSENWWMCASIAFLHVFHKYCSVRGTASPTPVLGSHSGPFQSHLKRSFKLSLLQAQMISQKNLILQFFFSCLRREI